MKNHPMISAIGAFMLIALLQVVIAQDVTENEKVIPKGDAVQGRTSFESKQCYRCHTVEGQRFPDPEVSGIEMVHLGGENNKGWDRDLYATQIMNPQHLISPDHQKAMLIIGDRLGAENSPMPDYTKALTVRELIDLATYLEERNFDSGKR